MKYWAEYFESDCRVAWDNINPVKRMKAEHSIKTSLLDADIPTCRNYMTFGDERLSFDMVISDEGGTEHWATVGKPQRHSVVDGGLITDDPCMVFENDGSTAIDEPLSSVEVSELFE